MTDLKRGSSARVGAGLFVALFVLAACEEKQPILQGPREDVRAVLQDPALAEPLDQTNLVNESRAIALGGQTQNANWTHTIGTAQYRVSHPALRTAPQLAWTADIGDGDSRKQRITADPVVSDGRVFTLDAGAQVVATSTSGATLWTRDLTQPSDKSGESSGGGLAVEESTLYVSLGAGVLAALDVSSGSVRWTQKLEATGTGSPTVYGDNVYVTAGDETGWALRKSDGRVAWRAGGTSSLNNVLGAPAPALTPQFAIFAFGSGEVQGVFRQGGLNRWTASVVGRRPGRARSLVSDVTSAPVVSGNTVYVGNYSGRLAALDATSGTRKWTARDGAIGPVWPAGDSIFAVTDLNELVRINAADGARIWGVALPNFTKTRPKRQSVVYTHNGPVVAGGRVIIASDDGLIRSYSPTDGSLLGTVEISGGATTAPVVAGGTMYVVSAKGQLHAYR